MRGSRSARRQQTLPAELTSFVGRRREVAEVKKLLAANRLLTLTGPGGVGKTRLAIRVASELARAFADGACLVELAALEDSSLVANSVAHALGLRDESARWLPATISEYLSDKQMLLVLDNCEHLLSATAVLADTLLRGAINLRILATSREPLGITGEANFAVPSLSVPRARDDSRLDQLVQYEAVRLFDERTRAIDANFRLTAGNRQNVVELCQRLDGIPLAIELAAVRTRTLSLSELISRLDDQFSILTQGSRAALPRQQTLRATIEWSWNLLSEPEQALWRRLSVFVGGFDRDAAQAVCADDGLPAKSIFDGLVGLIDKSILGRSEAGDRTRYGMLETLRQFAREKAHEAGETEWLSSRHLAWYAHLCEKAAAAMRGPERQTWLDRLEADFGNLQVALERAQLNEKDAETGIAMITKTILFWQTRRHQLEARRWLGALLARATSPSPVRLRGFDALASIAIQLGASDEARSALAHGLLLSGQLDDAEGLAGILTRHGYVALSEGKVETAVSSAHRAIDIYRSLGNKYELARALGMLGTALSSAGDLTSAEPALGAAIELANEIGNDQVRGHAHTVLGWLLVKAERHPEAEAAFEQALIARDVIDRVALGLVFGGFAYLAGQSQRFERAAILMGVVDGIWPGRPAVPRYLSEVWAEAERIPRTKLGAEGYQRAREGGRAMESEEAAEFAAKRIRTVGARPSSSRTSDRPQGGLSHREFEVASLVALGMSNKEIAAKLILSERTVDHHVGHILDKLGFNSRAQVAVWAAESAVTS